MAANEQQQQQQQRRRVQFGEAAIREYGRYLDEDNKLHLDNSVVAESLRRAVSYEAEGVEQKGHRRGDPRRVPSEERAALVAAVGREMLYQLHSPREGEEEEEREAAAAAAAAGRGGERRVSPPIPRDRRSDRRRDTMLFTTAPLEASSAAPSSSSSSSYHHPPPHHQQHHHQQKSYSSPPTPPPKRMSLSPPHLPQPLSSSSSSSSAGGVGRGGAPSPSRKAASSSAGGSKVDGRPFFGWFVRSDGRLEYREEPSSSSSASSESGSSSSSSNNNDNDNDNDNPLRVSRPVVREKGRFVQLDDGSTHELGEPDAEVLAVLRASGIPYRPDRPLAAATRHYLTRATQVCRAEADRVLILQALERIEKTFEVPPGSSSEQMHNQHRCATPLDDCRMALKRLFVMKMLG